MSVDEQVCGFEQRAAGARENGGSGLEESGKRHLGSRMRNPTHLLDNLAVGLLSRRRFGACRFHQADLGATPLRGAQPTGADGKVGAGGAAAARPPRLDRGSGRRPRTGPRRTPRDSHHLGFFGFPTSRPKRRLEQGVGSQHPRLLLVGLSRWLDGMPLPCGQRPTKPRAKPGVAHCSRLFRSTPSRVSAVPADPASKVVRVARSAASGAACRR